MNIRIENLTFRYPSGVEAISGIDLEITSGEAVAIIGENGAGKTTLAKHLNGLLKPSMGCVLIDNWDTREYTIAQLSRHVGYVFQNPDEQLFAHTVRAEVEFGPKNLRLEPEEVEQRSAQALRMVGLEDYADSHPYDLHVSKRKLVAIAAALAMGTPIVIFDEPTTGQDSRGMDLIGQIVEKLKSEGHTLITISHDLDFCAEYFERSIVLSQGRILLDGTTKEMMGEDSILKDAGLQPPQLVRLAKGIGLHTVPLTVEVFVEDWIASQKPKEGEV